MSEQSGFSDGALASSSVFVIDDDAEMRGALTDTLRSAGYKVQSSQGGSEALALMERTPAPDLIVLDLLMPHMSGWEFRIEQRRRPGLVDVPVIVLSADHSAEARAIHADTYLPKPFDRHRFLQAVELRLLMAARQKLELRAAALDRLSSLGVLAAGIAHEVNNPLAVLAGNVDLALALLRSHCDAAPEPLPAIERVIGLLGDACSGAARVAEVVRSVATFSHPQDSRRVIVNVGDVLTSCLRLVANEVRHRAKLTCEFDGQLYVLCNAAQLGQVFINLLINATHAIAEGARDQHGVRVAGWRTADGRTIVEVSDTGRGIEPEHLSLVFDPFFTTKPIGSGMGLGLAISQRLVNGWGGAITVQSTLGRGTRFRVELPSYDGAAGQLAPNSEPQGDATALTDRRLRVMVVDDEPLLCELFDNIVGSELEIETFASAPIALAALRAGATFDVLLTDLMMPSMSGMDLYDRVMRSHPEFAKRTIFMTGGTFSERAESFLRKLGVEPLMKPFTRSEVLARIASVMRSEVCA